MKLLIALLAIAAQGCGGGSNFSSDSMFTTWTSEEGFSIALENDGTYRFCDEGHCFHGGYERPGAPGGLAIVLKGLFSHPEAARFENRMRGLLGDEGPFEDQYPDLDFTVNSGVPPAAPSPWCNNKPCVVFGDQDTGNNVRFLRREDRDQ